MTLLEAIATLFASAPAPEQILEFRRSEESRTRDTDLLEFAKAD
jgi:hypothetical protein